MTKQLKVYLDMDGVVSNFVKAALHVHGRADYLVTNWNFFSDWGMNENDFWKPIDNTPSFWHELEPYENTLDIVELVSRYDSEYIFLTTPHNHTNSYAGKCYWLQKYFNINVSKRCIMTSNKELLCKSFPNSVLIDDSEVNCKKWTDNGGISIIYPQMWNPASMFVLKQLDYLTSMLNYLTAILENQSDLS